MDPEISELQEFARSEDPLIKAIVLTVLQRENCISVHQLFKRNPDMAFELHDEICGLLQDTAGVADFEHDLEREVM